MGTVFSSDGVDYGLSRIEKACPTCPKEVSMGRPVKEGDCCGLCPGKFVFTCPRCKRRWTFVQLRQIEDE